MFNILHPSPMSEPISADDPPEIVEAKKRAAQGERKQFMKDRGFGENVGRSTSSSKNLEHAD